MLIEVTADQLREIIERTGTHTVYYDRDATGVASVEAVKAAEEARTKRHGPKGVTSVVDDTPPGYVHSVVLVGLHGVPAAVAFALTDGLVDIELNAMVPQCLLVEKINA